MPENRLDNIFINILIIILKIQRIILFKLFYLAFFEKSYIKDELLHLLLTLLGFGYDRINLEGSK